MWRWEAEFGGRKQIFGGGVRRRSLNISQFNTMNKFYITMIWRQSSVARGRSESHEGE